MRYFGLGAARTATDLFSLPEIVFLSNVWPSVRVAANWTDVGWKGLGYPNGPALSPNSDAIIRAVWGSIRRAAKFSDINWSAENIPANLIPAAPPTAAPVTAAATPNFNGSPLDSIEYARIAGVWPSIRVAANWKDISWPSLNFPTGPLLSAASDAALQKLWGTIRTAKWFQDINWKAAGMPAAAQTVPEVSAGASPAVAQESPPVRIPEIPGMIYSDTGPAGTYYGQPVTTDPVYGQMPVTQPVPEVTAGGGGTYNPLPYIDTGSAATPATPAPIQAGLFGSLPSWLLPAVGAVLLFSLMRGSHQKGQQLRRRTKRRA